MIPIKNVKEAEKMRQACRVASDILDRVVAIIRPGLPRKKWTVAAEMMGEAGVKSAFPRLSDRASRLSTSAYH